MPLGNSLPLIGHLYQNTGWVAGATAASGFSANASVFKKNVGPFANIPNFKFTSKGTHQSINLELPVADASAPLVTRGDILTITEQGGDGTILYAGMVIDVSQLLDKAPTFMVVLDPIASEAALTPFESVYSVNTDAAQMVRDAVAKTKHLTWTSASVPMTGQVGQFDFSFTGTVLKVLQQASRIAGSNCSWFIDEEGVVWFGVQSVSSATYTVKRGQDYTAAKLTSPIDKLYNYIGFIGGTPPGQIKPGGAASNWRPSPIAVVYDNGHIVPGYPLAAPSYSVSSAYGVRARMPHFRVPKLLDQTTLNNIASAVGAQLNRQQTRIELTLHNYPRIDLKSATGRTMRYWEPASATGFTEGEVGLGGYSPIYLIEDVQRVGNMQKVVLTDLIQDESDIQFQIDQMVEASATADANSIQMADSGVIVPGEVYGSTAGGPVVPTIPSFYP